MPLTPRNTDSIPLAWRMTFRSRGRLFLFGLSALLISAAGLTAVAHIVRPDMDRSTEFYLLASDGQPLNLHETIQAGQPTILTLGVVNHERRTVSYRVEARLTKEPSGLRLTTVGPGSERVDDRSFIIRALPDEAVWEHHVEVTALQPRERQLLEFMLFSPLPRDAHYLRTVFLGCGSAEVLVNESEGRATVTLDGGDMSFHECRIEAWQNGALVAELPMRIEVDEVRTWTFRFPSGETRFRLYDGHTRAIDDTGAEAVLQLWLNVVE
jgi:hypothetical protein